MRVMATGLAAATIALGAPPARAATLLDLRVPANVVSALQAAGFRAELKAGTDGRPYIKSSASGNDFQIDFDDCDAGNHSCTSLQFWSSWTKEPAFTPSFVNDWNRDNRFVKAVIIESGDLEDRADISTVGMTTQEQFTDVVKWFAAADASLNTLITSKRTPAAPAH